MWATESNSVAIHITLPSYLKCTPEGRLSGCLYEFDDESLQCTDQRSGELSVCVCVCVCVCVFVHACAHMDVGLQYLYLFPSFSLTLVCLFTLYSPVII